MAVMKKTLSVVIPVYNEEKTLLEILEIVAARPETAEIIIIDDASVDKSVEVAENYAKSKKRGKPKVKLLRQPKNMGKGAAIRRGFDEVTEPIVIVQDADREYTPADYPRVLEPILSGEADVVYGSRFQGGPGKVLNFGHMTGNRIITLASNIFTNLGLTDVESCYKVFKREVIQNMILETNRFGIEVEMTAKLAKARELTIFEVPINYNGRTYGEGKKITWRDGIAAFWHIFKFNVMRSADDSFKKPWTEVLPEKRN
jgi:glycosyltransferase involved in cell wall biosynthesis